MRRNCQGMPTAHSRDKICILSPHWSRQTFAIYSLAMQWMCQAHHSVVETRSASFHLSGLDNACNLFPCNAMDVSSPPLCSRDKICIYSCINHSVVDKLPTFACSMYNWSFHLKSISSQTSSLHQSLMFPYTHALLYSKNISPTSAHKIPSEQSHCKLNWSVRWVWPCL